MLVLCREVCQKIVIGDGPGLVTITVTKVSGERAWLGIEAPREIPVNRLEIYERLCREREGDRRREIAEGEAEPC